MAETIGGLGQGKPRLIQLKPDPFRKTKDSSVKVVIRLQKDEEAKALPILLRHSPGTVLQNSTYVVDADAATELRRAGVEFTELSRESNAPSLEGAASGERV